jgi:hypothetical protein
LGVDIKSIAVEQVLEESMWFFGLSHPLFSYLFNVFSGICILG